MTRVSTDTPEAEAARVLVDRQMLDYRTAIPGVVVAVSADGTTVDVQPAVSMAQTLDGETRGIPQPPMTGVPLIVYGSATLGLFVTVPVQVGDDGLLIVCDRAIDNFQHGSGVAMSPQSPSPRHHDMTDAVFLPGLQRASGAIPGFNAGDPCVSVRNRDDSIHLQVGEFGVRVKGNLLVEGNIGASGSIIDGNGIDLSTHRHGGVSTGVGTSGPAVP